MTEDEWLACTDPERMLEFLGLKARARKQRLFAVACSRRIWHLLTDPRSRRAVEIAERFADGEADSRSRLASWYAACRAESEGKDKEWVAEPRAHFCFTAEYAQVLAELYAARAARICVSEYPLSPNGETEEEATPDFVPTWGASMRGFQWAVSALGREARGRVCQEFGLHDPAAIYPERPDPEWQACERQSKGPATQAEANARNRESAAQAELLRCLFGDVFRPSTPHQSWLAWNVGTIGKLAQTVYEERAFHSLPILADALEDAGCDDGDILDHCRGPGPHVLGCWVLDALLGKE